ncbi:MAG: serine/threonine protein kinase [Gomphosphaeria aponina SAG 52.96 = DSM 107014]|uniref:non-specific serine/threonine protein kinase n=1 Tax=Gomphosphaeria aponina SAG 52.96 = DSM 107014 TaxID=1521640 RepID=A0A941GWG3_9CHRO|nr:serine/threonine protein kinase [Gomphosphaeria aponina SAG 52.96 = DSM 107014]
MNNYPDFSNYGYQITQELGHNRAGGRVTYQAIEINTQNIVVVKQFQFARTGTSWAEYEAYEREIEVLRGLDHPSIPRYLDSFQTAAGFCMVQEYKNAPSLANSTKWTPQQIKQIAIYVLEILNYLQNRIPPVIHRDLKPENILVDNQMNVYLVDFGFARIGSGEVAVSSVVKGTLGFMPPEQMFNRKLTAASDLYSLGATLICLLTNTNSTEVGNLMDATGRINFQEKIPQLTDGFTNWLQKMVEPNFQERYANAAEALDALIPLEILRPVVKNSQGMRTKIGILLASLAILLPVGYLKFIKPSPIEVIPFSQRYPGEVTITAEPNSTKNLTDISLKQPEVYFTINLSDLPHNQYYSVCQLFDGEGVLVAMGQATLETTDNQLKAWCNYNFKPEVDQPGNWSFQFYLDGEKVVEKMLNVSI